MDEKILKKYLKAGEIAKEVVAFAKAEAKVGMRVTDLAGHIEGEIRKHGAEPAFPVNVSIDDIAAHYTPEPDDTISITKGALVKIDIGVHVDGYIADTAFTVCSEKNEMIKSVEKALSAGLGMMKPGTKICEVSEAIETAITSQGFRPIMNLTGHSLDRFVFHGPVSIPNVRNESQHELAEGDVFALEPFATDGAGSVKDTDRVFIYRYLRNRNVRMPEGRKILADAKLRFHELPFCKRWLPAIAPLKFDMAMRQLVVAGAIEAYPVLRESANGRIAQAEHTVIVGEKPLVITA